MAFRACPAPAGGTARSVLHNLPVTRGRERAEAGSEPAAPEVLIRATTKPEWNRPGEEARRNVPNTPAPSETCGFTTHLKIAGSIN